MYETPTWTARTTVTENNYLFEWQTNHPAAAIAATAAGELGRYAALFGLSPVAERHLGTAPLADGEDADPFSRPKIDLVTRCLSEHHFALQARQR